MSKSLNLIAAVALAWVPLGGAALRAGTPPTGGTISIEPKATDGSADAATQTFVDALSEALTARGFTVFADQGHAASAVELSVTRSDVGMGMARVAGQSSPSMAGTGVSIPMSTGASDQVPLRRTRLEMRIHRRGETGIDWDGSAVTVREVGSAKGADAMVAADLIRALLQAYPTQPRDVIGVP